MADEEKKEEKKTSRKSASGPDRAKRRRTTRKPAAGSTPEAKSGEKKPTRRRRRTTAAEADEQATAVRSLPLPRLLERLRTEIAPALAKEFGYTSPMQTPRLEKVLLNIGLGEALENSKAIESGTNDLALITGQQPVTTRAKKSIAGFKIREGVPIGVMVTLRGRRMYEFMDRLISSALPRIRDFRGISRNSFDGRGNFSLGIREQVIFPEIDYNSIDRIRGLQVAVVTTAFTDREGMRLLELMGMPFTRSQTEEAVA